MRGAKTALFDFRGKLVSNQMKVRIMIICIDKREALNDFQVCEKC